MSFQNVSIKIKLYCGFSLFFLALLAFILIINSQINSISSISEKSINQLSGKEKTDQNAVMEVKKNLAEIDNEVSSSKKYFIIFGIICFIIGLGSSVYLSRLLVTPISHFIEILKKVNSGDFRIQSDYHSKDEIGLLSIQLNELISERKSQMLDFLKEAETIHGSTNQLVEQSEISESASSEVNTMISSVASTTQEISGNISSVASASEEMANSIREISQNTSSAANITKEAMTKANLASEVMNRLGKSSNDIGNIIKVISNIAGQTNLLALNATIEAARAGEAGKGFAVVANEVKELAKESAKSTENITSIIKAIQGDTQNAIEAITEIIQITHKINDISSTIASSIEEQSITVAEVTKNLTEATSGVTSINETAQGILIASEEVSKISGQIKDSSKSLKVLSEDLENKLKGNFKI